MRDFAKCLSSARNCLQNGDITQTAGFVIALDVIVPAKLFSDVANAIGYGFYPVYLQPYRQTAYIKALNAGFVIGLSIGKQRRQLI